MLFPPILKMRRLRFRDVESFARVTQLLTGGAWVPTQAPLPWQLHLLPDSAWSRGRADRAGGGLSPWPLASTPDLHGVMVPDPGPAGPLEHQPWPDLLVLLLGDPLSVRPPPSETMNLRHCLLGHSVPPANLVLAEGPEHGSRPGREAQGPPRGRTGHVCFPLCRGPHGEHPLLPEYPPGC